MKSKVQVGELRLSSAGVSTSGGGEVVIDANVVTVESSATSATKGGASTKRTVADKETTLEILQDSMLNCKRAGIKVQVYDDQLHHRLVIVLAGVTLDDDANFTDIGKSEG